MYDALRSWIESPVTYRGWVFEEQGGAHDDKHDREGQPQLGLHHGDVQGTASLGLTRATTLGGIDASTF